MRDEICYANIFDIAATASRIAATATPNYAASRHGHEHNFADA
jgi:hypothetical protein